MLATLMIAVAGLLGAGMFAASARADSSFSLEPVVAANSDYLSTIVINGTNLPVASQSDIGEENGSTGVVKVADDGAGESSCVFTCGWDAGYNDDDCEVTIGASTPTQMILGVGDEGALCFEASDDYVESGDNITVTLYNADGSTFGTATATATGPPGTPSVSSVDKPYGPEGGGTSANPGTGSVKVQTSSVSSPPEAFWFASTGITTDLFGVATTNFTATGTPGEYDVVPPAFSYGGQAQNDGVSVLVADQSNGMSDVDCTLEISGCDDEYLYLDSDPASLNFPSLNGFELTQQLTSFGSAGNACGQTAYNNASPGGSITANFSGGPIDVTGNFGTSDSDSGLPEALVGSLTVNIQSPITIEISGNLTLGECLELPYPDLALPDGLGGLYFVVGGSITGSVNLTETIDQGSYTINGGFVPGSQPADLGGAKVTTDCQDANGNPTTDCASTALSASLTGTVAVAPLWLSFGPSQVNVGAGLIAAATGTITYPPSGGSSTDYDVCAGGLATAQIGVGSFSASYSYPWAGPFNIIGDGSICPIGSISSSSPVSNTTAPTISSGPYPQGTAVTVTDPGTWTTPDTTAYTYQWQDCTGAGTGCTNSTAADATSASYTPAANEVGSYLAVIVTATDNEGDTGTATASTTSPVTAASAGQPAVSAVNDSPSGSATGPVSGGTPIIITGTGFVPGATTSVIVSQGTAPGAKATDVNVVSSTEITATTAAATKAGTFGVYVTTPGGRSAYNGAATFKYVDVRPAVSAVSDSPSGTATGPVSGGTPIIITGTGFVSGASVAIAQGTGTTGAISATDVTVVSPTEITATTGAATKTGSFSVYVKTPGGTSATNSAAAFKYTYSKPTVSAVSDSPSGTATGPVSGGTPIIITGTGFVSGASVAIAQGTGTTGAISATDVTVVSPTEITATTGAATKTGSFSVYVKTPGGTSATNSSATFKYVRASKS